MNNAPDAKISEIFSSVQGEGLTLGEKQIFVRFAGCNLRCSYCDTQKSQAGGKARDYTVKQVADEIKRLNSRVRHSCVSLTGGEPLKQAGFLKRLLPEIKKMKLNILLETNGYYYKRLEALIKYCRFVSMDIKLPSVCGKNCLKNHLKFLKAAKGRAYVKLVISDKTKKNEALSYMEAIKAIYPDVPVVIQPASVGGRISSMDISMLRTIAQGFKTVLIIPQHHPVWGAR